ncbi:helicase HerA-like domain-containing protein [Bordetella pseudohinzii]|uniref:ATP-binding protein n=1 Tax=Bordetella pseudohinzii TaxID=1331258 RepID=A0A0J6BZ49_9BORD|nr:helicase HerA-like domain-containing protein [Bordetella pseudohinzii]ANY15701.1 ATP-binding protein [Bordetella pseudohinzii]KMM23973.1 ATP-binding protein [Bordetella pseudohinzii]KXA76350.1 ATP-binding protein [Bordetella pseudohinzii]KXA77175.1 ATP-binding protein [Bordetella pseudohinzii]CUJ17138.1 Ornithine/acetylornithine aminotransferase [Bordetella pseudohinzii]
MPDPIVIAKNAKTELALLPGLANRHGCITGATGTGKTVTLQVLAESFSRIGTPVFMADVKGDLTGISQAGASSPKLQERLKTLGLPEPAWGASPVALWDVFGEQGAPVRATVSDMGPLLLARMLELNDTQEGVLALVFKVADDEGQLLLDLKDLRAMLQNVADRSAELKVRYGNVSAASVGAIQRALLQLESQGADRFFGEPMLDVADLMRTDAQGRGVVNILAADKLMQAPRLYGVFLLWLLADLYEKLPEIGDPEQPKLVFFFDEAHLLFNDAPGALLTKIEQVVRLVRSKGVGVYFVTQNPLDIPDSVLGQLGNRVQHALRAFTPRDQKAVKTAAQTMRPNPGLDIEAAITELGVGEALVSLLDAKGRPTPTERAWILAPGSRIGPATDSERAALRRAMPLAAKYEQTVDRESAYERLNARAGAEAAPGPTAAPAGGKGGESGEEGGLAGGLLKGLNDVLFGSTGPRGGKHDGMVQTAAKSAVRQVTRDLVRGVLGSLLGSRRR